MEPYWEINTVGHWYSGSLPDALSGNVPQEDNGGALDQRLDILLRKDVNAWGFPTLFHGSQSSYA